MSYTRAAKRGRDLLRVERRLRANGIRLIAGVDEVGVGPLAGPVVAAAVVFPEGRRIAGVRDSKQLSRLARERLDVEIRERALAFAIAIVDVDVIDAVNIYHAGLHAMRLAVAALSTVPEHVLVDARTIPELGLPQSPIVGGDASVYAIAAASIVAKVHRDRLMREHAERFPGYGFERHVGYGTELHREALRRLGPCAIHRRSFRLI